MSKPLDFTAGWGAYLYLSSKTVLQNAFQTSKSAILTTKWVSTTCSDMPPSQFYYKRVFYKGLEVTRHPFHSAAGDGDSDKLIYDSEFCST